jgi:hypothetical protein
MTKSYSFEKIFIALISLFFLSLGSCNQSTVTPGVYAIIGKWQYVSPGEMIAIFRTFNANETYLHEGVYNTNPALNVTLSRTYTSDCTNLSFTYSNGNTDTGKYSSTDLELTLSKSNENGPTVYIKQ